MKKISTILTLLWLLTAFVLPAQSGQLSVTVSPVTNPHICGTTQVIVTFYNSGPSAVEINQFDVDLDNFQDGLITLSGIYNSPDFSINSGLGTSIPSFTYGKQVEANKKVDLTLEIQYSCAFFDQPGNLDDYFILAKGEWTTVEPEPTTYSYIEQNPNYTIEYSYITPTLNLPVINAAYETPFEILIPLAVTGNYCDNDFSVSLQAQLPCLDYSNATYSIIVGDIEHTPVPIPVQLSPGLFFEISAKINDIPSFCGSNYPGGMGAVKLRIQNVVAHCGCGIPGELNKIKIGFTSCANDDAPEDCKINGNVVPQEVVVQEIAFKIPPAGNLTVTNIGSNGFGFCNHQNILFLQVSNPSADPVYHVGLDFLNQLGYTVSLAEINNTVFNNNTPGTQMHLSFENNLLQNLGLQDLNGDGIFAELAPGTSFNVNVYFNASLPHCSIGTSNACNTPCQTTTVNGPVIEAIAHWNNICNTLAPAPTKKLKYEVDISPVTMNVKYDGGKLGYAPSTRTVRMELNLGSFEGLKAT
jgi:hypothetical protein